MVSDEAVDEFLVCPKCGTRIKATRTRCLRCFEPLDTTAPPPVWRTLTVSDRVGIVAGTIAVAVVLGFAWVLWSTSPPFWEREAESPSPAAPSGSTTPAAVIPTVQIAPARSTEMIPSAATEPGIDATREVFENKLKANPNDAVAVNGLGLVLEREGLIADAVARFKRAAELAPDRISYRMNLAAAEGRLGNWDRAVAEYREAAKIAPDDYGVRYNLGLALHRKGDAAAAVTELENAVRVSPNDPAAYRALGTSLEATGRVEAAVDAYARSIELAPGTEETQRIRKHAEQLTQDARRTDRPRRNPGDQGRERDQSR
jgi:cytochrome c-type biogenesis protein CcmH/NrfG